MRPTKEGTYDERRKQPKRHNRPTAQDVVSNNFGNYCVCALDPKSVVQCGLRGSGVGSQQGKRRRLGDVAEHHVLCLLCPVLYVQVQEFGEDRTNHHRAGRAHHDFQRCLVQSACLDQRDSLYRCRGLFHFEREKAGLIGAILYAPVHQLAVWSCRNIPALRGHGLVDAGAAGAL